MGDFAAEPSSAAIPGSSRLLEKWRCRQTGGSRTVCTDCHFSCKMFTDSTRRNHPTTLTVVRRVISFTTYKENQKTAVSDFARQRYLVFVRLFSSAELKTSAAEKSAPHSHFFFKPPSPSSATSLPPLFLGGISARFKRPAQPFEALGLHPPPNVGKAAFPLLFFPFGKSLIWRKPLHPRLRVLPNRVNRTPQFMPPPESPPETIVPQDFSKPVKLLTAKTLERTDYLCDLHDVPPLRGDGEAMSSHMAANGTPVTQFITLLSTDIKVYRSRTHCSRQVNFLQVTEPASPNKKRAAVDNYESPPRRRQDKRGPGSGPEDSNRHHHSFDLTPLLY
ncbi:unnamed protein product [Caenorhabditis auriculariae]|uniref:Uncharacterized protein n=1 Tax=Caenorhabditis auriculariae TaxID=2777116 RepID=A0A8S1GWI0_9PELO|nr:unnamed protein product [Caenorhabditis auriculariae]